MNKKELIGKVGSKVKIASNKIKPRVRFHKSTDVEPSKKRYYRKRDKFKSALEDY